MRTEIPVYRELLLKSPLSSSLVVQFLNFSTQFLFLKKIGVAIEDSLSAHCSYFADNLKAILKVLLCTGYYLQDYAVIRAALQIHLHSISQWPIISYNPPSIFTFRWP